MWAYCVTKLILLPYYVPFMDGKEENYVWIILSYYVIIFSNFIIFTETDIRNIIMTGVGEMLLKNDFYESVTNKLIDEEIQNLKSKKDYQIDTKQIDDAEGSSILSKYMSTLINKSLNRISVNDKLNNQICICNIIINILIDELGLHDFTEFIISENAELLLDL